MKILQRKKLKPFFGHRISFIGRLDTVSPSKAPKTNKRQVLVKDIVFEENFEYVCDHVWMDKISKFDELSPNDIIKFQAKVYNYPKSDNGTIILQYGLKEPKKVSKVKKRTQCDKCMCKIEKDNVTYCRKTEDNKPLGKKRIMKWCPNNEDDCKDCENLKIKRDNYFCKEAKKTITKITTKPRIPPPHWCPERSENMNIVGKLINEEIKVEVELSSGKIYSGLKLIQEDTYNYLFERPSGKKKYIHKANIESINFFNEEGH